MLLLHHRLQGDDVGGGLATDHRRAHPEWWCGEEVCGVVWSEEVRRGGTEHLQQLQGGGVVGVEGGGVAGGRGLAQVGLPLLRHLARWAGGEVER